MVKKRGLGGLGGEPDRPDPTAGQGWGDYILRLLNPLSQPPPSNAPGPAWRDVIVPPASTPAVTPPGLLEFLNPFSAPPGQAPVDPVSYRGLYPKHLLRSEPLRKKPGKPKTKAREA